MLTRRSENTIQSNRMYRTEFFFFFFFPTPEQPYNGNIWPVEPGQRRQNTQTWQGWTGHASEWSIVYYILRYRHLYGSETETMLTPALFFPIWTSPIRHSNTPQPINIMYSMVAHILTGSPQATASLKNQAQHSFLPYWYQYRRPSHTPQKTILYIHSSFLQ